MWSGADELILLNYTSHAHLHIQASVLAPYKHTPQCTTEVAPWCCTLTGHVFSSRNYIMKAYLVYWSGLAKVNIYQTLGYNKISTSGNNYSNDLNLELTIFKCPACLTFSLSLAQVLIFSRESIVCTFRSYVNKCQYEHQYFRKKKKILLSFNFVFYYASGNGEKIVS